MAQLTSTTVAGNLAVSGLTQTRGLKVNGSNVVLNEDGSGKIGNWSFDGQVLRGGNSRSYIYLGEFGEINVAGATLFGHGVGTGGPDKNLFLGVTNGNGDDGSYKIPTSASDYVTDLNPHITIGKTATSNTSITATMKGAGWDLTKNGWNITITLSKSPTVAQALTVYWSRMYIDILTGAENYANGSFSLHVAIGVTSYSFFVSNDDLKTSLGTDYVGLSFDPILASEKAKSKSYIIDNAATIASETFSESTNPGAANIIGCGGNVVPLPVTTRDQSKTYTFTLGNGTFKWNVVYAKTSSINTSDERQKKDIQPLAEQYSEIFDQLKPVSFKFKENESNRTHTGLLAQDVRKAVEATGMDIKDFAAYCEWENGEEIECGMRYEELIAICINEIQKLKKRVAELEEKQ